MDIPGGKMKMPNPLQIQQFLSGLSYPVTKQQLIDKAKENGATAEIMKVLGKMPDKQYASPAEVTKEASSSS